MNSFEINKILGALLGTCLILLVLHITAGAIFSTPAPAKPGWDVAVKEEKGGAPEDQADRAADRKPAGERVGRTWSAGRQAMRCLPQLPGGPGPEGRPRPL